MSVIQNQFLKTLAESKVKLKNRSFILVAVDIADCNSGLSDKRLLLHVVWSLSWTEIYIWFCWQW